MSKNFSDLPTNITGTLDYFDWVAETASIFWPIMLLALWTIIFVHSMRFGASRSWIVASLICGLFGTFISVVGWMDPNYMYLFVILFAAGLFWRSLESGQGSP